MSQPNVLLLVAAVLYPVGCFLLLRGVGIPGVAAWVFLGFVLPACAAVVAVVSRLAGVRLAWVGVAAFALWVTTVGWCCRWLIEAIWNSI